ncbi:hypothetical protein J3U75_02975 [Snodgrassella sp. B3088]|uniref:hypothetical protein n=1 Tax=Snodgrassella sp. B3088 TaxID=2818038 RepID=UPI00226AD694|nr:hypothetical protein [Snodgrassella sp. B3088]MCX8748348.1 hypothetical protein [Snodgrassella sp. B3088]
MNDHQAILKVMKEWRCNSKAYAKIYLFACCVCAFISLVCGLDVLTRHNETGSLLFFTSALICTFFLFRRYKNKRHNIKQVRFTTKAVYIEKLKLDISYLKSVEYIRTLKNSDNSIISIEFSMTFFPNTLVKDNVHFYMEFGKILFGTSEKYDYQRRFINVLKVLAKDRREQLKKHQN